MALTLVDGTVIPTVETYHARTDSSGRTTLPDGRVFIPAELLSTEDPCPDCAAEGRTTFGGYTPRLARRSDDGFLGCITHSGARLTGMREVQGTATCPDCGVPAETAHEDGCDVARCTLDGMQRLNHDHPNPAEGWGQVWTGLWPGDVEIAEGLATDHNDLIMKGVRGDLRWNGQRWVR
jgi:hypothetical protein